MFPLKQAIFRQSNTCKWHQKVMLFISLDSLAAGQSIHQAIILIFLRLCPGEGFKLAEKLGKLFLCQEFLPNTRCIFNLKDHMHSIS
jgi:hypothetical protein